LPAPINFADRRVGTDLQHEGPMSPLATLRTKFIAALSQLPEFDGQPLDTLVKVDELVQPSGDSRFGDYQANLAMPLAKRVGENPRELAAKIVAQLDVVDFCEPPEVAGPGFINLRLRTDWLAAQLTARLVDVERLGVATADDPQTIIIDYSSPNVAKPMHVGHIRSTVIGDALARVLKFLGHRVITDNHIGDWGTQFGMIIYGTKHFAEGQVVADVAELSRRYRLVNQLVEYHEAKQQKLPALEQKLLLAQAKVAELSQVEPTGDKRAAKAVAKRLAQAEASVGEVESEIKATKTKIAAVDNDPALARLAADHPDIGQQVLAETAALHAGDATNLELWHTILPPCLEENNAVYRRLDVEFDHTLGESFYHDRLANVVDELVAKGLATESDGAMCVFIEGYDAPFIVRKKDGAFLYSTTDLATIAYRAETWQPDIVLYVVDHRQRLHFEHLFATARLAGYDNMQFEHVSFGTVLGEDGKPYKTRSGSAVGLMGLLDEAVIRARAIADQSDKLATDQERAEVAERIGIGAIKYADLAHNRTSDYVFSYDKMLATTGNSAAYMQYSYARANGIFARAEIDPASLRTTNTEIVLDTPAERGLGLAIVRFAEALDRVAADYRPNHLTSYLFELASRYSEFFENCPVLKAPTDELRTSRLALADLTARTIARGLNLLGIAVVKRM
jgi:arginyl-tRNA synthetase